MRSSDAQFDWQDPFQLSAHTSVSRSVRRLLQVVRDRR